MQKKLDTKQKLVIALIAISIITLFLSVYIRLIRVSAGNSEGFIYYVSRLYKKDFISIHPFDLIISGLIAASIVAYIYIKKSKQLDRRDKEEYGSAKWGSNKDIAPFINSSFDKNIIFSETERMTIERPSSPLYQRNLNVRVQGGSGSGKTRFFLKPNILQMSSSYVVIDTKGTVMPEVGNAFVKGGYKIKCFDVINFERSMHFNPFEYIKTEADVLSFAENLIKYTDGNGSKGDEFWTKAERLLYCALISYIVNFCPSDKHNLPYMISLIDSMQVKEDDEDYKAEIDLIFEALEEEEISKDSFCVRQYKKYKQAAGKTAKSILISCGARLSPFDVPIVREVMSYDELELDKLSDEKTILFLTMSDNDSTFNFLFSLMFSLLFQINIKKADKREGGRLAIPLQIHADEFANIGLVKDIESWVNTIRSRNISLVIYLQTDAQLKAVYDKKESVLRDGFDTFVYLGGGSYETCEKISKELGNTTIEVLDTSESRGSSRSTSISYKRTKAPLMAAEDISVMPRSDCMVFISGVPKFYSKKYDYTKHPKYHLTGDYDKRQLFDFVKYRRKELNFDTSLSLEKLDGEEIIEIVID